MWESLLILAASALAKYQNDRAAQKRQEGIRSAMEAYQRSKAREGEAATEELIAKQTPDQRAAELANVTTDREKSLRDTVGAAQAFNAPATAGKVSADLKAVDEANANRIAERTRRAIEQLAVMGAPGEQKLAADIRYGRAAGEVDAVNRASDRVGSAFMTDIKNVRPNPYIDLASQIGMGVGTGMLASGAGAAAAGGGAAQPNLVSPNNAAWGSLDAGEGAYSMSKVNPTISQRLGNALGAYRGLWGTR